MIVVLFLTLHFECNESNEKWRWGTGQQSSIKSHHKWLLLVNVTCYLEQMGAKRDSNHCFNSLIFTTAKNNRWEAQPFVILHEKIINGIFWCPFATGKVIHAPQEVSDDRMTGCVLIPIWHLHQGEKETALAIPASCPVLSSPESMNEAWRERRQSALCTGLKAKTSYGFLSEFSVSTDHQMWTNGQKVDRLPGGTGKLVNAESRRALFSRSLRLSLKSPQL